MFKKITRKKLSKFLEKHASAEKVLDIGSGGSRYNKYFPNCLTLDIDPAKKPEIVADAHNLPFGNNEFQTVLCTEVLEHVENPGRVISEMRRVLKPNGKIILTTRFMFPLHEVPGDYWRFTKYGLKELFKNWDIEELTEEARTFETIAVLLQRIGFQTNLKFNKLTKLILYISAYFFLKLDFLIKDQYGNVQKTQKENCMMSSGYYLCATKKIGKNKNDK